MTTVSSLPFIRGTSSPTRSPAMSADHEASLVRQVEHWHQLFMDSEAAFAQVRADEALVRKQLSGALERERILASKNLELRCAQGEKDEALAAAKANEASVAALCDQLSSARLTLQCKDDELQTTRRQLTTREEELARLRGELSKKLIDTEQHKAMESELCDVRKRLEAVSKKLSAKEHYCEVMEQELQALRGQLPLKEAELEKQKKRCNELEQHKKSMQWEISDLQMRFEASLKKIVSKDEELQQLQGRIRTSADELQKLQKCLQRSPQVEALEMELTELRSKLELALKQIATKEQLFELKEQEVEKLRGDFLKEHELCHAAVSDNCELRQIYCEKLNALGEQEAKHQRSVKLLEAEREMWLSRSDHLEKINTRLRMDLSCLEAGTPQTTTKSPVTFTPSPPPRPSTAKASIGSPSGSPSPRELRLNYPRAGRTLLQHRSGATDRYDQNGKLRSFDAEGNEI